MRGPRGTVMRDSSLKSLKTLPYDTVLLYRGRGSRIRLKVQQGPLALQYQYSSDYICASGFCPCPPRPATEQYSTVAPHQRCLFYEYCTVVVAIPYYCT